MRTYGLTALALAAAACLLAVYACAEYERAASEPSAGVAVTEGVVLAGGPGWCLIRPEGSADPIRCEFRPGRPVPPATPGLLTGCRAASE